MIFALRPVTIDVPDCPTAPPSPLTDGNIALGIALTVLLCLAVTIAVGIVRYRAHERKEATEAVEAKEQGATERERIRALHNCPVCGTDLQAEKPGRTGSP